MCTKDKIRIRIGNMVFIDVTNETTGNQVYSLNEAIALANNKEIACSN